MSIQEIRLFGDPVLLTPASPVVDFDKELRKLVADLTDTMLEAPGAGLAAPQIRRAAGAADFASHRASAAQRAERAAAGCGAEGNAVRAAAGGAAVRVDRRAAARLG